MKTRLLIPILVLSLLFSITHTSYGVSSDDYTLGIVKWSYDCHPLVFNMGLIQVIDPDMNKNNDAPDRFEIEILSDYNENDIQKYVNPIYTVIETGNSTGIFESTIFWGDPPDEGIGHRVPIWDNSTVTATYTDNTLPLSNLGPTLDITSSMIVKDVKPIKNHVISDFYYVYEPCTVELWDMKKDSKYTVEHDFIFPPPLKQLKSGITIDEIKCGTDLVKVIKKSDNTTACIKSESKSKLIQRDWIKFQFSFCGVNGFDSKDNLNKSNSTHHWDENECEWQYVGPATNSINKWSGAPIYKEQKENEN